jgi:hypothetical protein
MSLKKYVLYIYNLLFNSVLKLKKVKKLSLIRAKNGS